MKEEQRLTVSRFARRHGLSRSALLYYDRVGLLRPSGRSSTGYRLYGPAEERRLAAIRRYRQLGIPVLQIRELLDGAGSEARTILAARLDALHEEIGRLREQERVIVRILDKASVVQGTVRGLTKDRWVEVLRATGLSDEDMQRWHVEFERLAPQAHADFLASLGMDSREIDRVRGWSRAGTR